MILDYDPSYYGERFASRGVGLPLKVGERLRSLPPYPTNALPGSEEKIRVLEERARLGYHLWHPLDITLD